MNERILELADKAIEDMPGAWNIPDEFCKKFAELIVKDVRWVMQTAADDFILDENYDAVKGVGRCMRRVKQHFGVEE
jgi:hypothetical protein